MEQRNLGLSGVRVSSLCLGSMNFGNPGFGCDEKTSIEIVHRFLDAGGNFIDTADAYTGGESERIVGRAVRGRRDGVVIATKAFFPRQPEFGQPPAHANALGSSRRHLTRAIEESLTALGTDYVDLYQVHSWDGLTPIEETLSTLSDLVHAGKTRYVGFSNFTAWQAGECRQLAIRHGWEPFVTAQMQYSLIERSIEHEMVPVLERYGIGLLPWSPLGQGVLTGKYTRGSLAGPGGSRFQGEPANDQAAAWRSMFLNERAFDVLDAVQAVAGELDTTPVAVSLAWCLGRPAVSSVIIGPKSAAQLEANLAAVDLRLGPEEAARLDEASRPAPPYPVSFQARTPRAG